MMTQSPAEGTRRVTRTADSESILDAALTLFADRGYHGTSLKQVAELVGVRTPSLYNHMDSKASLLKLLVFKTLDDIDRALDESDDPKAPPSERLVSVVRAYAVQHATHQREALVVNQETKHLQADDLDRAQELRRSQELHLRRIIVAGNGTGDFSVEVPMLASFSIREMCVSIARWFHPDGALSVNAVADQYSLLALNMVRKEA